MVRTDDGFRVVVVSGVIMAHYAVADRMAEAYAMVNPVEHGWAEQPDVARAFGCSTRSVRRHQDRFQAAGLAALGRTTGDPPGRRRFAQGREPLVQRLKALGVANREIARRPGVTPKAVRKLLKRLGWHEQDDAQIDLPITRITTLERTRAALPDRVPIRTVAAADVVKLAPERHLLTSLIKSWPTKPKAISCDA